MAYISLIFSLLLGSCNILFAYSSNDIKVARKPLTVYWNVPSFQCNPFKLNFTASLRRYGILHNQDAAFRGKEINILYDPGSFPAILKKENDIFLRNGGVPQEGNLTSHLGIFEEIVGQLIPDANFSGLAIIDFESWRPIYRQNWGILAPYKKLSEKIEKQKNPLWPNSWIKKEAAKKFEHAAQSFMEETLIVAKSLRPKASWGYYHYPYCFYNPMQKQCPKEILDENESIRWLFNISDALYPSVYLQESNSPEERVQYIEKSLIEALRVKKELKSQKKLYVYFWYKFQDTGHYITKQNLLMPLVTMAKYNIDGVVLWGASADVNSKSSCLKLQQYIDRVFGPTLIHV